MNDEKDDEQEMLEPSSDVPQDTENNETKEG